MKTKKLGLYQAIMLIIVLLCSNQLAAEERGVIRNKDGFYITLPAVTHESVAKKISQIRAELKSRQSELAEQTEKKRFGAIDTLLTIFMPGGLIYATIRRDSFNKSKQKLLMMSRELDQLSVDLITFQQTSNGTMVATAN